MEHYKNLSLENIEGEAWMPVKGYEGLYEISSMGRIKTLRKFHKTVNNSGHWRKEKIMKQNPNTDGYLGVDLRPKKPNNEIRINRLVAIHFIPNPHNKPQVNHKTGIKTDNRATELEWVTMSENHLHAFRTGLKKPTWTGRYGKNAAASKAVVAVKEGITIPFESTTACARYLHVSLASVLQAIRLDGNCKNHKIKRVA